MQKIIPCLWFDGNAEAAANFYVSMFKNSKIVTITRYGDAGPGAKGSVLTVTFQLAGQDFMALNGGPKYKFSPAMSLFVSCKSQREIDRLWDRMSEGGEQVACGWLRDKFGVSWQIVPSFLGKMFRDQDAKKVNRVMKALLKMKKLDGKRLRTAFDGR